MTEERQKMIEKLQKLNALAQRGTGGEKETARRKFEQLKEKYSITDMELVVAGKEPERGLDPGDLTEEQRGLVMALGIIGNATKDELENCDACPYTPGQQECRECGTFWNIQDLQKQFEVLQEKLYMTEKPGGAAGGE